MYIIMIIKIERNPNLQIVDFIIDSLVDADTKKKYRRFMYNLLVEKIDEEYLILRNTCFYYNGQMVKMVKIVKNIQSYF